MTRFPILTHELESMKGLIGKAVVSLSMFSTIHHIGSDCHTNNYCHLGL